jgi:hypothetical protein
MPIIPLPPPPPGPIGGSLLASLYWFLIAADTSGLDADRAAAIMTVRAAIGKRMFPGGILDEGIPVPALTFMLVDNGTDHILDGISDGLYRPRIQFDVWAMRALDVEALANALRTSLDGLTNAFLGSTEVDVLLWDNEIDKPEVYAERRQYCRMLDFRIMSAV